jgi:flagellar hook assembly protein FlgD
LLGQEVKTLVNNEMQAGSYEVNWNGDNNFGQKVSSGIYLYTINAGKFIQSQKMILLK